MPKTTPEFTINSHFEGKAPNVREIYDQLIKGLTKIGPLVEEPKKTSIHLVRTTALAGVATRKAHLILTLKSNHLLTSPRIHKSEKASAARFYHKVKLTSPADVDGELLNWLAEAYALSA